MLDTAQINLNNTVFVSFFSLFINYCFKKKDMYLLEKQQLHRIPHALVTKPSF